MKTLLEVISVNENVVAVSRNMIDGYSLFIRFAVLSPVSNF